MHKPAALEHKVDRFCILYGSKSIVLRRSTMLRGKTQHIESSTQITTVGTNTLRITNRSWCIYCLRWTIDWQARLKLIKTCVNGKPHIYQIMCVKYTTLVYWFYWIYSTFSCAWLTLFCSIYCTVLYSFFIVLFYWFVFKHNVNTCYMWYYIKTYDVREYEINANTKIKSVVRFIYTTSFLILVLKKSGWVHITWINHVFFKCHLVSIG